MNQEGTGNRLQWMQWLAACAASSVMFNTDGLDVVWLSDRKEEHEAPLIAIYTTLVIVGAIIGADFADNFGRKNTLLMMLCFVIPRTLTILFDRRGLSWIYNCVLDGLLKFSSGITCTLVPLYISEISDTDNRGSLMVMQLAVVQAGILAVHTTISLSGYHGYIYQISALGAALFSVSIFFHAIILGVCPETPQYLNWKKMYRDAAQSVGFYRGISHVEVEDNARSFVATTDGNNKAQGLRGKICEIFQFENRSKLAIIFSLITIKWASGIRINDRILIYTILKCSLLSALPLPVLTYFTAIFIFSVFIMFTSCIFEKKLSLLVVILGSLTASVIGMTSLVDGGWVLYGISTIQHLGHLIFVATTLVYVGNFFSTNVRATAVALIMSFEVLSRSIICYIKSLMLVESGIEDSLLPQFCFISVVHIVAFFMVLIIFPKTSKVSCSEREKLPVT